MATQRTTYGKRERDRAKQAKAAAKRERRQDRSASPATTPDVTFEGTEVLTPAQLFAEIEGRKPAEIATELNLSPNAASALVARARRGLRTAYMDELRRDNRPIPATVVSLSRAS